MNAALTKATRQLVMPLEQARALLAQARTIDEVMVLRDQAEMMRLYLLRRDHASEAHADAWEIVQHANRKLGQLIAALPKTPAARTDIHPEQASLTKSAALKQHRIARTTANRYQRLAALPEAEFAVRLAEQRPRATRWCSASPLDSDERVTPVKYLDAVRAVLGAIELDPASDAIANESVRAARFYTKAQNGLTRRWKAKTLFLSPPPSRAEDFVTKFIDQHRAGAFLAGIVLVNNATETRYFQSLLASGAACFPNARIPFVLNGEPSDARHQRQGQTFFYLGRDRTLFGEVFAPIGTVVAAL